MQSKKQLTIGFQIVSLSDAYNNALIDSMNVVAAKLNINLLLFLGGTPGNPDLAQEHQQSVIYDHITPENVDAIILLTPTLSNFISDGEFQEILEKVSCVPVVSIGFDLSNYIENQASIVVDAVKGLSQLIEYLITEQTYKKIAFVTGPLQNPEALMRFNTYKDVLTKHNIEIEEDNIYYGNFIPADAAPALEQFLSNQHTPEVIVCSNDVCALAMIEELEKRNIRVPEDIAVTGFDNIGESKTVTPALSTVSQSFLKMGALAFNLAVDLANNKKCEKLYTLDTIFIKRDSCGFNSNQDAKIELEDELHKYVLPFDEKQNTQKSSKNTNKNLTIFDLLNDIIKKISKKTNEDVDQSIVEFEEHYLPILEERIKSDIRLKSGYTKWMTSVEILEKQFDASSSKGYIIDLISIMIRERLDKESALVRNSDLSTRDNIYFIKGIIEELAASKSFEELANKIRSQYQQLSHFIDLENYVILGYPDPIKKTKEMVWEPPSTIDMILSFNDIENKKFKNTKRHDSKYIFPQGLEPNKTRYTMVVEALYSSENQLGRATYELFPREIDLFSCAMITTQIASTIRIIHQNKERKLAQKKIDLLVADLEAKKQMAEEAVIAKGHFLATMSHEIRTPMNGVLGVTELLQSTELSNQQNEYLEIIQNSANSLLNIISDILDFSKIEEGKLSVEHIEFNLLKLCNEVMSVFSFNANQKNIELKLDIDPKVHENIVSDPTRLRQILINLIGNAFKFTEQGSITLSIQRLKNSNIKFDNKQDLLKFSIIDTGIGISKENIEKLFGAFNQADSSITRKFGGSGLGLSISKSLSELMGGDIGVTSHINSGSTFWFTIQSRADSTIKIKKTKNIDDQSNLKKRSFKDKKILIAEDNKVNQLVIKGMIKKLGAQVTIVDNGQEAFITYQANIDNFDLIVMDFEMPVLDGASSTRKIRALENLINSDHTSEIRIPIIAITAHAMQEHKDSCIDAGMDDYLSKPIDSEMLYDMLDKYL